MAVGAAFVLGLATEYSHRVQPIPVTAWLLIPVLAILVAGLVSIETRQRSGAQFRLTLLNGGTPQGTIGQAAIRNRHRKAPIPFLVVGKR